MKSHLSSCAQAFIHEERFFSRANTRILPFSFFLVATLTKQFAQSGGARVVDGEDAGSGSGSGSGSGEGNFTRRRLLGDVPRRLGSRRRRLGDVLRRLGEVTRRRRPVKPAGPKDVSSQQVSAGGSW